jgi:hypothetical protein
MLLPAVSIRGAEAGRQRPRLQLSDQTGFDAEVGSSAALDIGHDVSQFHRNSRNDEEATGLNVSLVTDVIITWARKPPPNKRMCRLPGLGLAMLVV